MSMKPCVKATVIVMIGSATVIGGCAAAFLGLGDAFTSIGSGLNTVGECLSPLDPVELNEVLGLGDPVEWTGVTARITDAAQPEARAFLSEQFDPQVPPIQYMLLRFYRLGALSKGQIIEVEVVSDALGFAALYGSGFHMIPGADTTDDNGRRTIRFPIRNNDPEYCLGVSLFAVDEPPRTLANLIRISDEALPSPSGQTVVLNFSGAADVVTLRSGQVAPTDVAPFGVAPARDAAATTFRSIYAPYNLIVLTDADPMPDAPFSVIHIGLASPALPQGALGFAEFVDQRNVLPDDVAIVDLNHVALRGAGLLDPAVHGAAIGTVAAHEMGHLVGLSHVADIDALMTGVRCQGSHL